MTRWVALLGVALIVAVALTWPPPEADVAPLRTSASPAVEPYLEALEHLAESREREATDLILAALRRDPEYAPAYLAILSIYAGPHLPERVYAELDALADAPGGACAAAYRSVRSSRRMRPDPAWEGDDGCGALAQYLNIGTEPHMANAAATRLSRRYPESPHLLVMGLRGPALLEDWGGVLDLVTEAAASPILLVRSVGMGARPAALRALGRAKDADRAARIASDWWQGQQEAVELIGRRIGSELLSRLAASSATDPSADSLRRVEDEFVRALESRLPGLEPTRALMHAARGQIDNGQLVEALRNWNTLVAQATTAGEPEFLSFAHMNRGRAYVKAGQDEDAERDLLLARTYATRSRPLYLAYEAEHNLFHLYEAQGRDDMAREAGRRFVELTYEGGLTPVRMMSAHDVGWYVRRQGDLAGSSDFFAKMLADIDSLAAYYYYAGEYYERTGDLGRAAEYYELEWNAGERGRGSPALGLARVAEAIGDLRAAIRWAELHDALEMPDYPEFYPILPGILARAGDNEDALRAFDQAMLQVRARGQVTAAGRLALERARVDLRIADYRSAERFASQARSSAESTGERELAVWASAVASVAEGLAGSRSEAEAIAALDAAIQDARAMRLPALESEVQRLRGDVLIGFERNEEALGAFASASTLVDSIAVSLLDDPDRAGYRAAQIEVSNRALSTIHAWPAGPGREAWFAAWLNRRKARDLRGASAAGGSGEFGRDARLLSAVRAQLPEDAIAIDYAVLDTAVVALVVAPETTTLVTLPVSAEQLSDRVSRFVSGIAPRVGSSVDITRAYFDAQLASELYADLLEPLETWTADASQLLIVPDGPLHSLPFAGLVISNGPDTGRYVVERWSTWLAPSLALAAGVAPSASGEIVAVAPPDGLSDPVAIDREIDALRDAWPGTRLTVLEGEAATQLAIERELPAAGVLHFATHSLANPLEPDFSWINVAADDAGDGRLHAHEVRRLDLQGTLVVLSACETAAGRLAGGEGVLSLGRAFLQAGASGVIASHWPVGEGTADLMAAFHTRLAAGAAPATALREAQLTLLRGSRPEPFHWAPFMLVGAGPA